MSDLSFKTNFIEILEGGRLMQENYDFPSNVRNIIFVLSDGNEVMRNYAYLVGADLFKDKDKNLLKVTFTSDNVLIEGYNLISLRDQFMDHIPRLILPSNMRYDAVQSYSITKIEVGKLSVLSTL